mmetsp:Transcript_21034/g.54337  ORF Transcript_21034/g.54337 Transcript_21034/m.54337 type:complete len:192 (+) Transcript_21034:258-833(+)
MRHGANANEFGSSHGNGIHIQCAHSIHLIIVNEVHSEFSLFQATLHDLLRPLKSVSTITHRLAELGSPEEGSAAVNGIFLYHVQGSNLALLNGDIPMLNAGMLLDHPELEAGHITGNIYILRGTIKTANIRNKRTRTLAAIILSSQMIEPSLNTSIPVLSLTYSEGITIPAPIITRSAGRTLPLSSLMLVT